MRRPSDFSWTVAAAITICFGLGHVSIADEMNQIDQGQEVAFDVKRGNCLACHQIEGGDLAGDIGPVLVAMKYRFPNEAKLRAQIWDPTLANPSTMMPPFGLHGILTEDEIDKVTAFIYSL